MKKAKILITSGILLFFLMAFSTQASAQWYYKNDESGYRYKIQPVGAEGFEVFVKKTVTDSWSSRQVTYSDEELIKYKNGDHEFAMTFNADHTRFTLIGLSNNKNFGTYYKEE